MSDGGRSRAGAIALLFGVAVAVVAAVVVPLGIFWTASGAEIRDARMKIERARERAAARDALEQREQEWERYVSDPASGLIPVGTDSEAVEALKRRVEALFSELGGAVSSVEGNATDGPRSGVRGIEIDARGTLPEAALGALLTSLETAPALLIVTRFSAETASGGRSRVIVQGVAFRQGEVES